ncbi:L-ascorbate oxidase [Beta vulgaris subsp. vulgaris]|uniref:L-ascorbate oxidase n=1 Tax=Beta vulgaris subsp. vulgaris TaxID=3555 RepID=UPI002547E975|nr:L-ascorbate oxidase [Beta vulgaris subsp. vulgaris]
MASESCKRTLLIFMIVLSLMSCSIEAKTRYYKWDVKYEFKSPDCYRKLAITINGMSPGPTITAEQGDTVVVEVTNGLLTENLAIHWHGIRQIGTPWSDGTEGVSQCPVIPGDTFVYKFVVDRPGTYLYHAHYGMQREEGLNGMIHVSLPVGESEPFTYDFDRSIMLTDWYHKSAFEHAVGLASIPFVWVGEPESLLIQGRGRFNCSSDTIPASEPGICNATNPECTPFVLTVSPGKTYRLRIGSLTSLSALNFEIEGHNMTVVEADGHYVEPFEVQNLFIYSGETYSVLVKANQDPSRNYWATSNVVGRRPSTPTGLAIFNYSPNPPEQSPPTFPTTGPIWNNTAPRVAQSLAIKAREGFIETPPATPDRVIVLLNTQNRINGHIKWAINNVSFTLPTTPYLVTLKEKKLRNKLHRVFDQRPPPNGYDWQNYDINIPPPNANATSSNGLYRLKFNTTIDIVLQNANMLSPNTSDTHPWHLHGHDFWVLGYGTGKFNPFNDPKKYNLVNPILKNTVPLHPYGWTAIRFQANNPGVWLFHCHIDSHFSMGMGIVFEEGIERVGKLPTSIMGCGLTKNLINP